MERLTINDLGRGVRIAKQSYVESSDDAPDWGLEEDEDLSPITWTDIERTDKSRENSRTHETT